MLFRIVGNDLYPRHKLGQARENVRFILEQEPPLTDCAKHWVVNRIVDRKEEAAILALLLDHQQPCLHIPFDEREYAGIGWDLECFPEPAFLLGERFGRLPYHVRLSAEVRTRHHKNRYVMNVNGARNAALRAGRSVGEWVLPWDGNCFVTIAAWAQIREAVATQPGLKYFVVPMARVASNTDLLRPDFHPAAEEEPQILFRRDAALEFDQMYPYGWRCKVELLQRLGVPGPWDAWPIRPWDLPKPALSSDASRFGRAGWVARLESGHPQLEEGRGAIHRRGVARSQAIVALLDRLDEDAARIRFDASRLMSYREDPPRMEAVAERMRRGAVAAIANGTYSVLDKTTVPPSGDPHDYWHVAPYWWPDPQSPDGLPYVKRDGERVAEAGLDAPERDRYDRARLQRLFDDTTVCALAWRATGEARFAEHGAEAVRRWFITPETAMRPHLGYAQVRLGHNGNRGTASGIIEMKDLYFFLDAVRLLERSGAFGPDDQAAFRVWLGQYRDWLMTSRQASEACRARNNHGTYFDLQLAAIAAFLDDASLLVAVFRRSRQRIQGQFEPDGSQPEEIQRTRSQHYHAFNLQGWVNLATLAERCGDELWHYETGDGRSIKRALEWLLACETTRVWPYQQLEPFDWERLVPLRRVYERHYAPPERPRSDTTYSAYDGIKPFWFL